MRSLSIFSVGVVSVCFMGAISFLRPGGAGCSWLLCEGCDLFAPALEVFAEPPLGQLCAVPLALVGVQLAGRAALELFVDRGVVNGEAGRDVGGAVSDQVPRLDLFPVLEGQVAVFSRRSHLRLWGRYKKKNAQATHVSLCAFNNNGGAGTMSSPTLLTQAANSAMLKMFTAYVANS